MTIAGAVGSETICNSMDKMFQKVNLYVRSKLSW